MWAWTTEMEDLIIVTLNRRQKKSCSQAFGPTLSLLSVNFGLNQSRKE